MSFPQSSSSLALGEVFLFFDVSSAKAILPVPLLPPLLKCTTRAADTGWLACFSPGPLARKQGKYGQHPLHP